MKFGDVCRLSSWMDEGQLFMSLGQQYDNTFDDGGSQWELVVCINGDGMGSWWTGMVSGAPASWLEVVDEVR